jgi:hypothetical protein
MKWLRDDGPAITLLSWKDNCFGSWRDNNRSNADRIDERKSSRA